MNKKNILCIFLCAAVLLTSCKNELEPQDSSGTPAVPAVADAPAVATPTQANMPTAPVPTSQPQTVAAPPVKTLPGMNPPHGQAGHRCDIAVGAPLSSPPGKAATPPAQPTTITPTQTTTTTTPAAPAILNTPAAPATPTAPGMNPPHGQEGHLCSIAVGAPLPKS